MYFLIINNNCVVAQYDSNSDSLVVCLSHINAGRVSFKSEEEAEKFFHKNKDKIKGAEDATGFRVGGHSYGCVYLPTNLGLQWVETDVSIPRINGDRYLVAKPNVDPSKYNSSAYRKDFSDNKLYALYVASTNFRERNVPYIYEKQPSGEYKRLGFNELYE